MKQGRPSKYNSSFDNKAYEFLSKGYSLAALCGHLHITEETLYQWIRPDGEYYKSSFSESIKAGLKQGQIFWESIGIQGVVGKIKGFNTAAWIFNMKNRFKWTDRQDVTSDGEKVEAPIIYIPKKHD